MKSVPSVAGVCAVRDACDLIELICGHYLRIGFGHVAFVDDGSLDGTFELISSLARRDRRVSVKQVSSDVFAQDKLINERANQLVEDGYSIIGPFDADEFWDVTASELEARFADKENVAFWGSWVNFVQRREAIDTESSELSRISYSAPGLQDAVAESVMEFKRPFVCYQEHKIAFKTDEPIRLGLGQHHLTLGPRAIEGPRYQIFHLPLRCRSEINKRGLNYEPRRAGLRVTPDFSWQSRFHRDVVLAGRVNEVWAANSADHEGFLDCYGEEICLNPDRRLQRHLQKSTAYLADELG